MQLLSLYMHGFRSFAKPIDFRFSDGPGLFFLRGENRWFPELGANGVGKSTVFDAVSWVFFGKTSRGLSAGDVETWIENVKAKGPKVEVGLSFTRNGQNHTLTRTRGPNQIFLDGQQAEQQDIEKVLGFNYDIFLSTLLMGQFGTFFFDLKPAQRLEQFSQVLGLDIWVDGSKRATARVKALESEENRLKQDQARLEGRKTTLKEQLKTVEKNRDQYEKEARAASFQLQRDLKSSLSREEMIQKQIVGHEEDLARTTKLIKQAQQEIKETLGKEEEIKKRINNSQWAYTTVNDKMNAVSKRYKEAGELKGACPYCEREITKECVRDIQASLARELESLKEEKAEYKAKYDQRSKEGENIRKAVVALDERLDGFEEIEKEVRQLLSMKKSDLRFLSEQITRLEADLKKFDTKANPFDSQVDIILKSMKGTETDLDAVTEELMACTVQKEYTNYWVKGFKEVRLWIVNQALDLLEVECNASMIALGLRGWKVSFAVDRETQKGTIAHGFDVLIQSPVSKKPVKWENWSGGETQRLRLAGAVGLSSLVRGQLGISSFFEAWDEPTEYLSGEGLTDLINFLKERAEEGRQIWMIDHRSLDAGMFTETFNVVLTPQGSELQK